MQVYKNIMEQIYLWHSDYVFNHRTLKSKENMFVLSDLQETLDDTYAS